MPFDPLPKGTADAFELEVLEGWNQENLFQQTADAAQDDPPFVFYEGPPTANGKPGIHHVFARTIKDMICRYRAMTGRKVVRIAGWDTHGLPVEISVEQELEISGKSDIETFGVAEFNRRCRESVFRYKADWEALSNRIGYWLDYDRPYVTYTNDYIESVWWLLSELWKKDLLYEGHKILPYCGRCGTALSSHELAMGYATHRSPSIHVLFRLEGDEDRYLLVWTTTPWTLPSNIAIAVNPAFTYVEVDVDGRRVILEQSIASRLGVPGEKDGRKLAEYPIVATHAGADLVGLRYEQLLDAVEVDPAKAFRVVAGDFVTDEDGTGLVHMAPAFGADDYATIRAEGLAFVNPVDESSRFEATRFDEINGLTVFEANKPIARRLTDEHKLFGAYDPQGYEHSYPFCWRCDSPLIYYARRSWFVRTTAFSEDMVRVNAEVNWTPPEVGSGRFGEWLENNVDWALSRDRYWGTPLPAWVCDADRDHQVVIGAFEELVDRTGSPLPDGFDPHKPFIDDVTFGCDQCDGTMHRVPEVIDAWFDSGAMPYAQWHYPFENKEEFDEQFPADYICEGLDQTRGWFYSLLAISMGVRGEPAYRNVIVNGLLLDATGRKMSKRLGNIVDPWDAVGEFGADAVRLYLVASSQVWLPKRFDAQSIVENAVGFINRLRNTYDFFARYAGDWNPGDTPDDAARPLIDRWLLSRLDDVVNTVNASWAGYDVRTGTRALMDFCDNELSNWYVRLNRSRFWAPDSVADPVALDTLHRTLVTVARLLAPAAPFLSDGLHRRLSGSSVHLSRFPEPTGLEDESLNQAMAAVRRLASLARSAREDAGLRVRQPLAAMQVAVPADVRGEAFDQCLELLSREVNVRDIVPVASDAELVTLRGKANFRSLGKVYGKQTPIAAKAVVELTADQLRALEAGETVQLSSGDDTWTYQPEDVVVERDVKSDWAVRSEGPYVAALNPEITSELRDEGVAREIVNRVQRLRKQAGYEYTTRIQLGLEAEESVLASARSLATFIAGETLARSLEVGETVEGFDVDETVDLDGTPLRVTMVRVDQ